MSKIKKNWEKKKVTEKIDKLLTGFDDGELFVEEVFSENIVFDDNKIKFDEIRNVSVKTTIFLSCLILSLYFISPSIINSLLTGLFI